MSRSSENISSSISVKRLSWACRIQDLQCNFERYVIYLGVEHGHEELEEFLHGESPLSVLLEVEHEECQVGLVQQRPGLLLHHLLHHGHLLVAPWGGGWRRAGDETQSAPGNIKPGRVGQDRHGLVIIFPLTSHIM